MTLVTWCDHSCLTAAQEACWDLMRDGKQLISLVFDIRWCAADDKNRLFDFSWNLILSIDTRWPVALQWSPTAVGMFKFLYYCNMCCIYARVISSRDQDHSTMGETSEISASGKVSKVIKKYLKSHHLGSRTIYSIMIVITSSQKQSSPIQG